MIKTTKTVACIATPFPSIYIKKVLLLSATIALGAITVSVSGNSLAESSAPRLNLASDARQLTPNERIHDRFRDYAGKLDAQFLQAAKEWPEMFIARRQERMTEAGSEIAETSKRIQKVRRIDATQLKRDPEFSSVIATRIHAVLEPGPLRRDLEEWARGVENVTRSQMIQAFQQTVAEDLGRKFDEKLRDKVVKAVCAIPIETLTSDGDAVAKIQQTILDSLPEAAISEESRKLISAAATTLVKSTTFVLAAKSLSPDVATLCASAAGEIARLTTDAILVQYNQANTLAADPETIRSSFERALRDWNNTHLQPRLESILSTFRQDVIEQVENEARKEANKPFIN